MNIMLMIIFDSIYTLSLLAIVLVGMGIANHLNNATHNLTRLALLSPLFAAVLGLIDIIGHRALNGWPSVLASVPLLILYLILLRELQGVAVVRFIPRPKPGTRRRTDRHQSDAVAHR